MIRIFSTQLWHNIILITDLVWAVSLFWLMFSTHYYFYPRPVLAFRYCRCLRLCVCESVCLCVHVCLYQSGLVRTITHHSFRLESPNFIQRCKRPWLRCLLIFGMINLDLQGEIELKSQILPHFQLVRPITHPPFKIKSPNLDQKCILAQLRSLLILDLIGLSILKPIFLPNLFALFCIIFSETRRLKILVRPSLVTDWISLGFWLNISFVVHYWGAFPSRVAIAIDLVTSEDRYFLWITAVPLPRRCLQSRQPLVSCMGGVALALSGPTNLPPELDHRYLILLLFRQPITSPKLYLPSVRSVLLVQTQLQYI